MSRVFLVLGFVLIMALYSEAELEALAVSENCCFEFFSGKIPPQFIQKVEKTGPHCPTAGFVVTTPKLSGVCVREVTIK